MVINHTQKHRRQYLKVATTTKDLVNVKIFITLKEIGNSFSISSSQTRMITHN